MIFLFFSSSLACLEPELELFEVWEINVRQIIIIANGINSSMVSMQWHLGASKPGTLLSRILERSFPNHNLLLFRPKLWKRMSIKLGIQRTILCCIILFWYLVSNFTMRLSSKVTEHSWRVQSCPQFSTSLFINYTVCPDSWLHMYSMTWYLYVIEFLWA